MKNSSLLKFGYFIPLVFWLTTFICGFILPEYNHAENMVSELGEIGTSTQHLFTIGLVLTSIFSLLFNIGLHRQCKKSGLSTLPVLILWTFTFSIAGAGIFSYPQPLHGLFGSPSIILFLSPLTAVFLWKETQVPSIRRMSLLTFIVMLFGFLVFIPSVLPEYIGIKQRIFHLGWSIWFIFLASTFKNQH